MSKTKKKPLPKASSAKNKSTAKAAPKKAAKPAAKPSKPLLKTLTGLAKALTGKGKAPAKPVADAKAKPVKAAAPAPAEVAPKAAKAPKKEKPGKKKAAKKGDDFELGDDLIGDDDGMGSEEIPDLSEFDENESEIIEEEDEEIESFVTAGENRPDDEVILTDAEGRAYCRVRDCDQVSTVEAYCRYHYLLLWKRIQVRRKILADGKLEKYVEELTARYPDKFLEMIRKDLRTEKDFHAAIAELEIDESAGDNEFEDEAQNFVDEMRGITPESGMSDEEEF